MYKNNITKKEKRNGDILKPICYILLELSFEIDCNKDAYYNP